MTRLEVLTSFGASGPAMAELLAYNANLFDPIDPLVVPLPSEPHVDFWRAWRDEGPIFESLARHLPQFRFPIREGISKTDDYRAATLRGVDVETLDEATGLQLERPEALRLVLHETAAGEVPVLLPSGRADFETLVRALAARCEPIPIRASMGACTVKGFNNWERIRAHRAVWLDAGNDPTGWDAEFARLQEHREAYQDRFLILSDGYYSDMSPEVVGIEAARWRELSVDIRTRHECAHYVTLRLFASMRNNVLDELIADFVGFSSSLGRFRADWFLRGAGLEDFPRFREGGRLRQYCPDLSAEAFPVLCALTHAAALNLERFDAARPRSDDAMLDELAAMAALCALTIEDMAADGADRGLLDACALKRSEVRRL